MGRDGLASENGAAVMKRKQCRCDRCTSKATSEVRVGLRLFSLCRHHALCWWAEFTSRHELTEGEL